MATIFIRAVPRNVKRAMAAAARERDTGMNDVAVEALSHRFGVPFVPTGRHLSRKTESGQSRRLGITDAPNMTLRVSEGLDRLISVYAAENGLTKRGVVISTVAARLGVDAPSEKRRSRSGRRASAVAR